MLTSPHDRVKSPANVLPPPPPTLRLNAPQCFPRASSQILNDATPQVAGGTDVTHHDARAVADRIAALGQHRDTPPAAARPPSARPTHQPAAVARAVFDWWWWSRGHSQHVPPLPPRLRGATAAGLQVASGETRTDAAASPPGWMEAPGEAILHGAEPEPAVSSDAGAARRPASEPHSGPTPAALPEPAESQAQAGGGPPDGAAAEGACAEGNGPEPAGARWDGPAPDRPAAAVAGALKDVGGLLCTVRDQVRTTEEGGLSDWSLGGARPGEERLEIGGCAAR